MVSFRLNPKKYLCTDTIQAIDIIYESYDTQKVLPFFPGRRNLKFVPPKPPEIHPPFCSKEGDSSFLQRGGNPLSHPIETIFKMQTAAAIRK
jgi:hypothetical protein